jgi:hypothetical protein
MKRIEKKRLTSKKILLIVLSSLLAMLILGYIIIDNVLPEGSAGDDPVKTPEILEGEALYLNTPIAYPHVSEGNIQYILVQNEKGSFDLTRPDEKGSFWLSYDSGGGVENMVIHAPPIIESEGDFNYETLYAKETGDGYSSIYMLTYLSVAIGTPYFSERIPLPENSDERNLLLSEYGFDKKKAETISFVYTEKDEKGQTVEKSHSVTIGGRAVSGTGYYFMVDDRSYVYYTSTSYFGYALKGFHEFVGGMLVSAGLPSDSAYEPYLTTSFKEWANTKHKEEGEAVKAGSNVIVSGYAVSALNKGADYVPGAGEPTDGYNYSYEY